METKKNPKADLTRKTGFFFSIALLITMSFVLFAFELKQHETPLDELVQRNTDEFELTDVPITEVLPPPAPVVVTPVIVEIPDDEEIEDEIDIPLIDIETSAEATITPIVVVPIEPEVPTDEPFTFVEQPASPIGGVSSFYKYLGENINYPPQARRMGVEGKVFVQFVVNRDGSIVDVSVVKGIGAGCDEEAVRVVAKAPAWSPGKQRGKPVRQKMIATVIFKLGN